MSQESRLKLSDIGDYTEAFILAEITGMDIFVKIVDTFGGSVIYIPTMQKVYRKMRDREIVTKYKEGTSIRELARQYKVSVAWISKILKDLKATDGFRK